jgi:ABC-type uncharacterized transport system involved in gliding motility auxiliary subunit
MLNQDLRRFAPYGLVISGVALLATFVLAFLYRSFNLPVQISLAVAVLGLALFVLLDPGRTREMLTGRQARYGSNALILTLAFLGIVIVINYLVYQNTRRWDLTEDQQNTLAQESIDILNSLKEPVKAEAYYTSSFPIGTTEDLLINYKTNSQGKFDYEVIDPNAFPLRAQQANVTRDGTIVLVSGDRKEQVSFASEQEITAALIRLSNPGSRAVYFLVGHEEYDIDNAGAERSYASVKAALQAKNYIVNSLNLVTNPQIPQDALAVIVAGPQIQLSGPEVRLLQTYLENGGSLIYMNEPIPFSKYGETPDPLAAYLEQVWGIKFGNDVVIDLNNQNEPLTGIINQFGDHPITQKMYTSVVLFPGARSVEAADPAPDGVTLTVLGKTTDRSWGETDWQTLIDQSKAAPDEGVDRIGPVPLAVAGENATTKGRVVVMGDSDFAGATYYQAYGNSDFLLNSIDWAAEQENLINLTAKQPTTRMLVMPDGVSQGLVVLGSIFLLPAIVIITGVTVWLQRRRRG